MTHATAWKSVVEGLKAEGVERVFGLAGNPSHFLEDLVASSDIPFILVRHEPSAVAMAAAQARLTGRPGVVFTNPGPGTALLTTNLLEATSASVPVVAFANGVDDMGDGKGAFQELDTVSLMRPVTKWATRIMQPEKTPWVVQRAFSLARNGRPGAVFVEIPSDIAHMERDIGGYRPHPGRHRSRPDAVMVDQAAAMIRRAERPVLLCGSGAVTSGAFHEVKALADEFAIPVLVSPGGRGIYAEDGPMFLGLTGLYFTDAGRQTMAESDLVISVGSRLEAFTTNAWSIIPKEAGFIQIDIDPDIIGMNYRPDVALVGDATLALQDLKAALAEGVEGRHRLERVRLVESRRNDIIAEAEKAGAEARTPIRPPYVLAALNRVFGRDTILVKENGGTDLWCYYWPYYKVLDSGDCVPMGEQTNMGYGVAGTIGAKLAKPGKQVVCVAGDGAMQMAMMELATAAEHKLGITWVVFDNQALGWVQYIQILRQQPTVGTDFAQATDLAAIAEAQGCRGIRVDKAEEVEPALEEAKVLNAQGTPVLLAIKVAKHDYLPQFTDWNRGGGGG